VILVTDSAALNNLEISLINLLTKLCLAVKHRVSAFSWTFHDDCILLFNHKCSRCVEQCCQKGIPVNAVIFSHKSTREHKYWKSQACRVIFGAM